MDGRISYQGFWDPGFGLEVNVKKLMGLHVCSLPAIHQEAWGRLGYRRMGVSLLLGVGEQGQRYWMCRPASWSHGVGGRDGEAKGDATYTSVVVSATGTPTYPPMGHLFSW